MRNLRVQKFQPQRAPKPRIGRSLSTAEQSVCAFFVDNPRSQPAQSSAQVAKRERALRVDVLQKAREGLLKNPDRLASVERLLDDPDPEVRELAGRVIDVAERDQRHFNC